MIQRVVSHIIMGRRVAQRRNMYNSFELAGRRLEDRREATFSRLPSWREHSKATVVCIDATEARRAMIIGLGHDARVIYVITIIMSEGPRYYRRGTVLHNVAGRPRRSSRAAASGDRSRSAFREARPAIAATKSGFAQAIGAATNMR